MDAKRLPRLLVLVAVLGAAVYLGAGRWPKDQTVHYVLGSAAPRVEEIDARWAGPLAAADAKTLATNGDWARESSFRYALGAAPRVVTHEPRMPDGDYTVEIEVVAARENATGESAAVEHADTSRVVVRRRVTLSGGPTSIDLGDSVPR